MTAGLTHEGVEGELAGERVLRGVEADIGQGTFLGIVGPNGSGKTTLLRAINGAIEADGTVVVGDGEVASLSARELSRRIATTPQNTDVSFEFTVEEVVRMGRYPHTPRFGGDASGAVESAMERVGVSHLADRSVHEVSGGERQLVLLARSLAQDTPVLLLDEPTASLDIDHAIHILEVVRSLVDGGRTAVAAIHDLDTAARYCDELLLLEEGSVVEHGAPETVLTKGNLESVFGTRVRVGRDTTTGSVRVTPLGRGRGVADGGSDGRVHIAVEDIDAFHRLRGAGYCLSVGVVTEAGSVARASERHDVPCVAAEPFSDVPEAEVERARRLADDADVIVGGDASVLGFDVRHDVDDIVGAVEVAIRRG